jgi:hypothetical protein
MPIRKTLTDQAFGDRAEGALADPAAAAARQNLPKTPCLSWDLNHRGATFRGNKEPDRLYFLTEGKGA